MALYFDDLNTTAEDLMRARSAAEQCLSANLRPQDRIGIFTSDQVLSAFTNDQKQLHDALAKLHISSHSLSQDRTCPNLSDYQAYEITRFQLDTSTDAWKAALDEAYRQGCGGRNENQADNAQPLPANSLPKISDPAEQTQPTSQGFDPAAAPILVLAQRIVEQAELQARSNLQELRQVVTYVSKLPGSARFF